MYKKIAFTLACLMTMQSSISKESETIKIPSSDFVISSKIPTTVSIEFQVDLEINNDRVELPTQTLKLNFTTPSKKTISRRKVEQHIAKKIRNGEIVIKGYNSQDIALLIENDINTNVETYILPNKIKLNNKEFPFKKYYNSFTIQKNGKVLSKVIYDTGVHLECGPCSRFIDKVLLW